MHVILRGGREHSSKSLFRASCDIAALSRLRSSCKSLKVFECPQRLEDVQGALEVVRLDHSAVVVGREHRPCAPDMGEDFAEVPYLRPLHLGKTVTRLEDLAVLCANCHRIAHRMGGWPTIGAFRAILR